MLLVVILRQTMTELSGNSQLDLFYALVCSIQLHKAVKFRDPWLNRSREIRRKGTGDGIFDGFFAITADRNQLVMSYPVWL